MAREKISMLTLDINPAQATPRQVYEMATTLRRMRADRRLSETRKFQAEARLRELMRDPDFREKMETATRCASRPHV